MEKSTAVVRAAFVGLVADNVLGRKPWIVGGRQEAQIVATGEQRIGIRGHRRWKLRLWPTTSVPAMARLPNSGQVPRRDRETHECVREKERCGQRSCSIREDSQARELEMKTAAVTSDVGSVCGKAAGFRPNSKREREIGMSVREKERDAGAWCREDSQAPPLLGLQAFSNLSRPLDPTAEMISSHQ